jgi:hypothetical protein
VPSLTTERCRFLHIPKTGGWWVTEALPAAGVQVKEFARSAHATLAEMPAGPDLFTFAFVRHPLDWWQSYWAARKSGRWDPGPCPSGFNAVPADGGFLDFIEEVLKLAPSACSSLYETYVGCPPDLSIDFVGRQENLADDLCQALRLAGEPFDEKALRNWPMANVAIGVPPPVKYTRALARALAECEHTAIQGFYPLDPVPERLVAD